ncbi:hypothetical protein A9Z40_03020 [Microbacterium arborescens]|uniref:Uncharacterized protein n=1 Tax=Microbacterium arborescens TaxID=33883 RepID=A0ABX2WIP6_9MICO|nr:hypothetical protein [Microbacterium arborescens]OAZ40928.1 hypothetical protein A9Z40_03020 [Microbacterium arborescens]
MSADLQKLGDRAAWLRREDAELRHDLLMHPDRLSAYWAEVEKTAGWAAFLVGRRARDLRQAMTGRRKRR